MKALRITGFAFIAALALLGIGLILTGAHKLREQPKTTQLDIYRVVCVNFADEEAFTARMRAVELRHARSDADAALILREIDRHYLEIDGVREQHC